MTTRGLTRLGGNLLLSAASLAILALVAELALQLVVPLVRPRFTRIDPLLGWYHNPSVSNEEEIEGHRYTLSYTRHGYRPPELPFEKPPGTRRVVVLGDSFVDASEVDDTETFTWLLHGRMEDVQIVNLGVYGYSTAQQLLTLERVGLRFDPDLVVLATLGNDFVDNLTNFSFFGPAPRWVLRGDGIEFQGTDHPEARASFRATNLPLPGMRFLHRNSLLYYVLNHYLYQRLIAERIVALKREQESSLPAEDRRELYLRLVSRMQERCEAAGAQLAVVFLYQRHELEGGAGSPYRSLAAELREGGIATYDLYRDLREAEAAAGKSLYYREDIHWNARGHAVVADLLEPRLRAWLGIPAPQGGPQAGGAAGS